MARRQTGLGGRGLDALLGGKQKSVASSDSRVEKLKVDQLQAGVYQPRSNFDQQALEELADSIKAQGLVQPIIVRSLAENSYEIIAGERRWRAAKIAGLQEIPAIVREADEQQVLAMALIENIQREDLNPLEEAIALQKLIKEFGITQQEAAEAVGKSRSSVTNLLRLLKLPEAIQESLQTGTLSMGHVRVLVNLPAAAQTSLATKAIEQAWSVRQMEQAAQKLVNPLTNKKPTAKPDPNIVALQDKLANSLGAKVQIKHQQTGRGRLEISYSNLDELDQILNRIG